MYIKNYYIFSQNWKITRNFLKRENKIRWLDICTYFFCYYTVENTISLFYFLTYSEKILYYYFIYSDLNLEKKDLKKNFNYYKVLKNIVDCKL